MNQKHPPERWILTLRFRNTGSVQAGLAEGDELLALAGGENESDRLDPSLQKMHHALRSSQIRGHIGTHLDPAGASGGVGVRERRCDSRRNGAASVVPGNEDMLDAEHLDTI